MPDTEKKQTQAQQEKIDFANAQQRELAAANSKTDAMERRSIEASAAYRQLVAKYKNKEVQAEKQLDETITRALKTAMQGYASWEQVMMEIWLMAMELFELIDATRNSMMVNNIVARKLHFGGHMAKGLFKDKVVDQAVDLIKSQAAKITPSGKPDFDFMPKMAPDGTFAMNFNKDVPAKIKAQVEQKFVNFMQSLDYSYDAESHKFIDSRGRVLGSFSDVDFSGLQNFVKSNSPELDNAHYQAAVAAPGA